MRSSSIASSDQDDPVHEGLADHSATRQQSSHPVEEVLEPRYHPGEGLANRVQDHANRVGTAVKATPSCHAPCGKLRGTNKRGKGLHLRAKAPADQHQSRPAR